MRRFFYRVLYTIVDSEITLMLSTMFLAILFCRSLAKYPIFMSSIASAILMAVIAVILGFIIAIVVLNVLFNIIASHQEIR